jgi:hypothetical protein
MNEPYENVRKKDRISYKHSLFQVDLTQVRSFTVSFTFDMEKSGTDRFYLLASRNRRRYDS